MPIERNETEALALARECISQGKWQQCFGNAKSLHDITEAISTRLRQDTEFYAEIGWSDGERAVFAALLAAAGHRRAAQAFCPNFLVQYGWAQGHFREAICALLRL